MGAGSTPVGHPCPGGARVVNFVTGHTPLAAPGAFSYLGPEFPFVRVAPQEDTMFLMLSKKSRRSSRGRSSRHRAKLKAKNRRRLNRMYGNKIGRRRKPAGRRK